jgi:enoyl-CoA hydratase/carnithine racemase
MALSGREVPALEAERLGLVDRVFPRALLMTRTREMAGLIAANPPTAVAATKQLIHQAAAVGLAGALEAEIMTQERLGQTDAFRAGLAAFRARRTDAAQRPQRQARASLDADPEDE